MNHTQPPLEIGMLLFPGLTLLDLVGPATVFSWFSNIHLVWKTMDLVRSDTGVGIQPSATFATSSLNWTFCSYPADLARTDS
jgi:cyclohexyl-isocyanide hydratase